MLKRVIIAVLLFNSNWVNADSIDLNLNDDSIRFNYARFYGGAEIHFGGLYIEQDKPVDEKDWIGNLGLTVGGSDYWGSSSIEGGLGGMIFGGSVADEDLLALGLGGYAKFFPGNSIFGIGLHGYYAPEIVTGLDFDRYSEVGARLEFRLLENASVYIGYREIEVRHEDTETTLDVEEEVHGGIYLRF